MSCSPRVWQVGGEPKERLITFTGFAMRGITAPEVERTAVALRQASSAATAAACLRYVQSLPYVPDRPGENDDVVDACRVLAVGGDCEDLSILLVALWAACGLTACLQWIVQEMAGQDHVTALVYVSGRGWLYGEPTVRGAFLGEDPYDAAERLDAGRGPGGHL